VCTAAARRLAGSHGLKAAVAISCRGRICYFTATLRDIADLVLTQQLAPSVLPEPSARPLTRGWRGRLAGKPSQSPVSAPLIKRLWHLAGDLRRCAHVRLLLANAVSGVLPNFASAAVRVRLYRRAGFHVSDGVSIMGNLQLSSGLPGFYEKLIIGAHTSIADHVTMNLDATVKLGAKVAISPRVVIYTGNHRVGPGSERLGPLVGLPVTIEDGAWVRLGAVIAPGVTVGRGSIVATGAVVLTNVPANTYVEGNPARVVRRLPWSDR